MKIHTPSDNIISIAIFTDRSLDVETVKKTLAHVYPGVLVDWRRSEKDLPLSDALMFMIDTNATSGAHIEHLLDQISNSPVILIVNDFADARMYSHLLTGRRSIVSRADLAGMGIIQGVHHLLERQKLHEQLGKTSRHLKELSIRDELTHLFNHHHLDEILSSEVKKSNRYRRPLAVVIVAIRNFASINESAGSHRGDRVLLRAAEVIRGTVREVDIPARYGDNEFAVILPESDEISAIKVAGRIQDALGEIKAGADAKLASSAGVAALSSGIRTKDELLRAALAALIEAKKSKGNSACAYSDIAARKMDLKENRQLIAELGERVKQMSSEAERNYFQSVVKLLADAPQAKKILFPHSERVAFFAQRLAESAGMSETETKSVQRAGFLHDAGKIAIDAGIISKPGRLSAPEEELVKLHPEIGIEILGSSSLFKGEIDAILYHHERFDGSGYPKGIAGQSIPLSARILAIAEAWDTMITPQVYRPKPLELDLALLELKNGAGAQFDAALVDRFSSLIAG